MNFLKIFKRIPKINLNHNDGFCNYINSEVFQSQSENISIENKVEGMKENETKESLFSSILNGIKIETKDFFIIDKPAGISLYRSNPLTNLNYNGLSSKVTVEDILPELRLKLKLSDDFLYISSELPWAYSGLFVLSKTKRHLEVCQKFYKNSSYSMMPGYINQSYRCLCWNLPRYTKSRIVPFSYSFHQPSDTDFQYAISYKCNRPSESKLGQSKYWTKHIGHDLVSVGDQDKSNVALVDVNSNSTYRGLIPLYLLHQGCIVLGEFVQASRLLSGGINNDVCLLPAEKANPAKLLPMQLRQLLGEFNRNIKNLPMHIHCRQLLVPSTNKSRKTGSYLTKNPIIDFNSKSSATINWESNYKLNICTDNTLPQYYKDIMTQLKISVPFDDI